MILGTWMITTLVLMRGNLLNADVDSCLKKDGQGCTSKDSRPVSLQKQEPILLWWYEDGIPHDTNIKKSHKIECPSGRACIVSCDRSLKNNPGTVAYIFYGTSFSANDLPLPRNLDDVWALLHEESPKNNWLFSHEDGISLFNYTATFSRESDYPLTTQYIVDLNDWVSSKFFVSTQQKNRLRKTDELAPVVYLQRDCEPPSDRDRYVKELMKHISIDSYGPCVNNKKIPPNIDGFHKLSNEDYFHFLARYKFHLSFENALCKDYMTEKLFRPLQIGVVPVYMGSSYAHQFLPNNHSAIFVDNFTSPRDLAKFLLELDQNDSKYNEYLRHHSNGIENDWLITTIKNRKWTYYGPSDKVNFIHRMFAGFECSLCDFISSENGRRHKSTSEKSDRLSSEMLKPKRIMACPEPVASIAELRSHVHISQCYWEGLYEAKALKHMLMSNETDSTKFESKYLKRKTDKYP